MRNVKASVLSALLVGLAGSTDPVQAQAPRKQPMSAGRLDHRELPADQQIIHALNRLTFGARPGDVQRIRAVGLDRWVEEQLHPERIDDSALQSFLSNYTFLNQDQNALLREFTAAQRERRQERRADDKSYVNRSAAESIDMRRRISPGSRPDSTLMRRRLSRGSGPDSMAQRRSLSGRSMDDSMQVRRMAYGRAALVGQLQSARVARAVASNRQLEEVMTDFWLNHFNVFVRKGPPQPYYILQYERDAIRPNTLGKFRTLLGAVAKSPAMLFYLDNARSMGDTTQPRLASLPDVTRRGGGRRRALEQMQGRSGLEQMEQVREQLRRGGLNENYGRELLELHTLGVDGGYTQKDVIAVSRALTGWTIKPPAAGGGFVFRPQMHDAGEKVVLGQKLGTGRGIQDGEQVLDIVARHPATARHIATKLARRFVSDDPPKALVDHATNVFLRTEGDIREVVRAILTSNEFYSRQAFRAKVKSPFEVVVSALRALGAQPDATPRTAQAVAYLGQPIYGHQAPNGYPETGESWMNTGAILNRINFGVAVAANRIPGVRVDALPEIQGLRAAPRAKQVDAIVSLLLGGSASPDTRAILLSGENPLLSRSTVAENPFVSRSTVAGSRADPINMRRPVPQLAGIAQVVGLALGSPEFQRR